MTDLARVRVVLVQPQVAGNIGASARAMAAMGLRDLWLVAPREFPHPEATRRATEASALLEQAHCVEHLEQAIGDCELVIATSARRRRGRWPHLSPHEAATRLRECGGACALVFGSEPSGLTSEQLYQAHFQSSIPLAESAHSLNLSHAVQVYAWELRRAAGEPAATTVTRATQKEMAHLYGVLEEVLELAESGASPTAAKLRRFQVLLNRAAPTRDEWMLLEGLLQRVAQQFKNPAA